jgi:TolA-binding protein
MKDELDLERFAAHVAEVQRPTVDNAFLLRRARSRLAVSLQDRAVAERPRRRWPLLGAAAAAAIFGAMMLVLLLRTPEALTFEVGRAPLAGTAGAILRSPERAPLPMRFSDGSSFSAAAGSELEVAELRAEGAVVQLRRGSLEATVVHRAQSRWRVQAGPYTVAVIGTRFSVKWEPSSRSFALDLHEGMVTVFGPALGGQGRRVKTGEHLELGPAPSLAPAAAAPLAPDLVPSVAAAPRAPHAAPSTRAEAPSGAERATPTRPSWKELATAGQHRAAFTAAEAEGLDLILARASVGDLLLLGNTARFAQQPRQAEQAFRAARGRKDGPHQRAVAAFELGRLAHDQSSAYSSAATWFERYLSEEPHGALAREAAGRLVEARHRAGQADAARQAARHYLELYPDGPYAKLARALTVP